MTAFFTREDIEDLSVAFDMCKGKRGISVVEVYNEELLELYDEEIIEELNNAGIKEPENLVIKRHDGFIEFVLE